MPPKAPAVPLDVADSPMAAAGQAHDKAQKAQKAQKTQKAQKRLEVHAGAEQGTLEAMHPTNANLESSQVQDAQTPSTALGASPPLLQDHCHDVVDSRNTAGVCVTTEASEPTTIPRSAMNEAYTPNPVVPSPAVVRPSPSPRDATPPQAPLSSNTATNPTNPDSPSATSPHHHTFPHAFSSLHKSADGAADKEGSQDSKMIFGHHATTSSAQRRRNFATTSALTDYEADLTSKDRAKQKEAVKKFLAEKVRADWKWDWPRPPPNSDSSQEESHRVERVASIDEHWKERDEWLSCGSENEEDAPIPTTVSSPDSPTPASKYSPFRFESPDGVGETIKRTAYERKRRRKRRLAEEMAWNDGLRCFVGRRDAWTGARRVAKPGLGFSPLKLTTTAQRSSLSTEDGGSSTAIEHEEDDEWEEEVEVPIAPAILPPENAMRASILPAAYNTIYDKVVVQALTPSCPMNLKDVTRSCVQGWKRDGEWPPKGTAQDPAKKKSRKLSVASLFRSEKHESEKGKDGGGGTGEKSPIEKGAIRRSLQKILSLGHGVKETLAANGEAH